MGSKCWAQSLYRVIFPRTLASAEEALRSAIAVAQGQGDSRLRAALRVAPSLAKLYQSAGRPADAHDVVGTGARRFRADAGNAGDRRGAGADGAFGVGSLTPIFRTFPGSLCRAGISRIEASKAPIRNGALRRDQTSRILDPVRNPPFLSVQGRDPQRVLYVETRRRARLGPRPQPARLRSARPRS
jgi:hypothetical protein